MLELRYGKAGKADRAFDFSKQEVTNVEWFYEHTELKRINMAVTQRGHEGMKIHTVLSIQCHAEQLWPGILEIRMSNGSFSSA